MKKTLVALAVAAFATTSASAATILNSDGTEVNLNGRVGFLLEKNTTRVGEGRSTGHTYLANDGSRIEFVARHTTNSGLYALGQARANFNGQVVQDTFNTGTSTRSRAAATTVDGFGNLVVSQAFVGLGSAQFGEITFGRRGHINDINDKADFAANYDGYTSTLAGNGNAVVRYDYTGVEGLTLSAGYRLAEQRVDENNIRAAKGEVNQGSVQSGYGASVNFAAEGANVGLAYTREDLRTGTDRKHFRNAYGFSAGYTVSGVSFGADYSGRYENNQGARTVTNNVRVGAQFAVDPSITVASTYSYGVSRPVGGARTVTDSITLSTVYNVTSNIRTYAALGSDNNRATRTRNINAGVGLRVSF